MHVPSQSLAAYKGWIKKKQNISHLDKPKTLQASARADRNTPTQFEPFLADFYYINFHKKKGFFRTDGMDASFVPPTHKLGLIEVDSPHHDTKWL